MGTTLHGIIECFIEADVHKYEHWQDFATIEFNKDYLLQSALHSTYGDERNWMLPAYLRERRAAAAGAPFTDSISSEQIRKGDTAHGAGWVTLPELQAIASELERDEDGDVRSAQLRGTIDFMRAMSVHYPKTRLLYYCH